MGGPCGERARPASATLLAALALAIVAALVPAAAAAAAGPRAVIRRSAHGIPHIISKTWEGIGYGYGYAFAQDDICPMADDYVTVRAQRSRYFGPTATYAQQTPSITQTIAGSRLDISATGEVTRVPDIAIISAGVVSRSATATGALQDAADRMQRVLAALKRAGVADRDVQTSNINLNPEYRYVENQPPQLTGYTASNLIPSNSGGMNSRGT